MQMEAVSQELKAETYSTLWFYCNSLKKVTHLLWWGSVPRTSDWTLGCSWVPVGENAHMVYSLGVTNESQESPNLCKHMAGETDLLITDFFLTFQGSPPEGWPVKFLELIALALRCCSSLKILTPYWFPMAFQKRRTFLINHMKGLWYDIIGSWRHSKSKFQIPLLPNVYLSDLICWQCSNACDFLHGRL